MSKTDKGQYEKKAKDAKFEDRGMTKKTGTGESIDSLEQEERYQREKKDNMLEYVNSTVQTAVHLGDLCDREFYLIHVNYFYVKEGHGKKPFFAPAEYAVVRFSLKHGIIDVIHDLVYCKPLTGYALAAKERSETHHHIPTETGEDDYAGIYNKLKKFISCGNSEDDFIPLYTLENDTPIVRSFLDMMAEYANADSMELSVYHWEMLYFALRSACVKDSGMSIPVAGYEINKDLFSSTLGLECSYHRNLDGHAQDCSMSFVKRWVYTVCDYCCDSLNITMRPGAHHPLPLNLKNPQPSISSAMSSLNLGSSRASSISSDFRPLKSMTGVSSNYQEKVSSRSEADEKYRRENSGKITIIEKGTVVESDEIEEARAVPVRSNGPKSWANLSTNSMDAPDLRSEFSFPSIGKGRGPKGPEKPRPLGPFGRGNAWAPKN